MHRDARRLEKGKGTLRGEENPLKFNVPRLKERDQKKREEKEYSIREVGGHL